MKWQDLRQSDNVEDQRGMSRIVPIGGVGTLILAVVIYFLGGDPRVVLDQSQSGSNTSITRQANPQSQGSGNLGSGNNDEEKRFVSGVLGDTELIWGKFFEQRGQHYRDPKLVLFTDQVRSACGVAGESAGPFYCPNDEKVYIDLAFFQDLKTRYGASGDFAEAYVIAHEVGHHVQKLMGTMQKADALENGGSKSETNQVSVRLELQADFYAGVWAHYAKRRGLLDPGDVEEALNAASAVGDDRLQKETQGYVVPDSFTHGTSAQRVSWFKKGLDTGDLKQGDTFEGALQ